MIAPSPRPASSGLAIRFRSMLLYLTNRCNLECVHCYVASGPAGAFGLTRERTLRLLDEAHDLLGPLRIALTGGEALVRKDDCLAVLEHGRSLHEMRLLTNGTLIDDDVARRLTALDVDVRVSVDGAGPEAHDALRGAGAFHRTRAGLETLLAAGFPRARLGLMAAITPWNLDQVEGVVALAESLGIARIRMDALNKIGRAREHWAVAPSGAADPDNGGFHRLVDGELERRLGGRWTVEENDEASLPFASLNVYSDGSVYPFTSFGHPEDTTGRIGDIREHGLGAVLRGPAAGLAVLEKFLSTRRGPPRSSRSIRLARL